MGDQTMMGVDSSTDVQDFEEFLQDEIFVDYFNIFLSLPVRRKSLFQAVINSSSQTDQPLFVFHIEPVLYIISKENPPPSLK